VIQGLSSIEPDEAGGEKGPNELVVAHRDGAKLLEAAEEVLDQMARLVEFAIERLRMCPAALAGDHRGLVGGGEPIEHVGIGVECLFGDRDIGGERRQEGIGAEQVMTSRQEEV